MGIYFVFAFNIFLVNTLKDDEAGCEIAVTFFNCVIENHLKVCNLLICKSILLEYHPLKIFNLH